MAVSKNTMQESAITKGIPGHEELKIYLASKLFQIDMTRFNITNDLFVEAVDLVDKFGEAEGVVGACSTYRRSNTNNSTTIKSQGTYDNPMTPKGIEQLYDNLCSKLGR